MDTPETLKAQATEVMMVVQDSVEHLCHEHMMSGEKVWVMIRALADSHIAKYPDTEWISICRDAFHLSRAHIIKL